MVSANGSPSISTFQKVDLTKQSDAPTCSDPKHPVGVFLESIPTVTENLQIEGNFKSFSNLAKSWKCDSNLYGKVMEL